MMRINKYRPNASLTRTLIRHPGSRTGIALPTPSATAGGRSGDSIVHSCGYGNNGGSYKAVGGLIDAGHVEQRFLFLLESFEWLHWWHGHGEARRVADRSSGISLRGSKKEIGRVTAGLARKLRQEDHTIPSSRAYNMHGPCTDN